jgi:hypothetical protein
MNNSFECLLCERKYSAKSFKVHVKTRKHLKWIEADKNNTCQSCHDDYIDLCFDCECSTECENCHKCPTKKE